MEKFWPTFPYLIPASQGMPLWWYISWWIFQIVVMGAILYLITRWAVRVDRVLNLSNTSDKQSQQTSSGTTTDA